MSVPEEDRTGPVIGLELDDAIGRLVIEHTTIKPFTGQIGDHRIRLYTAALPFWLQGCLAIGSRFEINLGTGRQPA